VKKLRAFLFHPLTDMALGAVLALTGLAEMMREVDEVGFHPRAHHGIALYGLMLILKSGADVIEGTRKVRVGGLGRREESAGADGAPQE
jgi:hypothetical protein